MYSTSATYILIGYFFTFLFLLALPLDVGAASLFLQSDGIDESGLLKLDVYASTTQKEPFNAAGALISVQGDSVSIERVETDDSIFSLWTTYPNISGGKLVAFSGGTPAKGGFIFTGKLMSLFVKPSTIGTGTISILGGHVLAHDGKGTDILSHTQEYSF